MQFIVWQTFFAIISVSSKRNYAYDLLPIHMFTVDIDIHEYIHGYYAVTPGN